MEKLRVLFVDHYATTPEYPGLSRNFDICANLVKAGWKASLVLCSFNHSMRTFVKRTARIEGVDLRWAFGMPYSSNSWSREVNILSFSVSAFLKGVSTRADAVIVTIPTLESALSAYYIARTLRVPLILNIEDLWPDSLIAMGVDNKVFIGALRRIERFLYRKADHILIIAEKMRSYLQSCGVDSRKISLLPLGANLTPSDGARDKVRARFGWTAHDIVCGYVGSHGPANALETIVKAASQLEDHRVRVVLLGDGSDKERLRRQASDLKLTNVQFLNAIPPNDVPSVLRGLDIAVATLKNTELFRGARPTKLFEYMEAGLPIVCAIDGEARQFLEDIGAGVFVPPEEPGPLAAVIAELANDESRRRTMGDLGRHYIEEHGSREQIALQLRRIVTEMLQHSRV